MSMNVTWFPNDLEVYKYQVGVVEATILTIVKIIVLGMAVIAQITFYQMMKRLPGRAINQILYPHMVRSTLNYLYISMLNFVMFIECFCTKKRPLFQVEPRKFSYLCAQLQLSFDYLIKRSKASILIYLVFDNFSISIKRNKFTLSCQAYLFTFWEDDGSTVDSSTKLLMFQALSFL